MDNAVHDNLLDEYLTDKELAAQMDNTVRTLNRWILKGDGPPYVYIGKKKLFRRQAVLDWLRSREKSSQPPRRGGTR